jgi:aspartyl aminopeptidase
MLSGAERSAAEDLLQFIGASPTPYHAVATLAAKLGACGYSQLDERDTWRLRPGDRRFVKRGGGTLVAFECGQRPPDSAGFLLLAAHTDSPNLRLKPTPDLQAVGYQQWGIEVYGGVLHSTWLDRDLSVAGRVSSSGGRTRLIDFRRPLCRISNLAIHLERTVNNDGLKLNPQKHLLPSFGLEGFEPASLLELVASELSERHHERVTPSDILGFDLCLYDTQPGALAGAHGEFIHSARLDNLASCHAALVAFTTASAAGAPTRVLVCHDHEEIGSQSSHGAKSRLLLAILERIALSYAESSVESTSRALARSLLVSLDMAHAVHPNYAEKHDAEHQPRLGLGPTLKVNANQSYATDGVSRAFFEEVCRECSLEPQRFVSRNDLPCGSTIGPISAARLGIRALDVGNPMLSMHSCRESAGTADVAKLNRVLTHLLAREALPDPAD